MSLPHLTNHHFFFFNDTATTEIYTLSLHDALPICFGAGDSSSRQGRRARSRRDPDRSEEHMSELQSHYFISYAVFCLEKKITHVSVWKLGCCVGIAGRGAVLVVC